MNFRVPATLLFTVFILLTSCTSSLDVPKGSKVDPEVQNVQKEIVLSCFINHSWYSVNNFSGIIPGEIARKTGVSLDVTVATDNGQLGVMLASGNMPDLIYSSNMLDRLSNSRVSYCYDDLISEYDIKWEIPQILRMNSLSFSSDGKLYTILNHYSSTEEWKDVSGVPMAGSLIARQDILDELGNPPINNFDDLMHVYELVKENYPDIIPLIFNGEHRFNVFKIWIGLGILPFAEQKDGSYVYSYRDEKYFKVMKLLNEMYLKGYLLPDNFVAEESMAAIPYKTGMAFSYSSCTQNSNVDAQADLTKLNPNYLSVELMPIEGANYNISDIGWSGTFITKSNKHPKESMEFIRWMFTEEAQKLTQWGREGIDYVLGPDKSPIFSNDFVNSIRSNTNNTIYNPWFYFGGSAIVEAVGRYAVLDKEIYEDAYTKIRQSYKNYPWMAAAMPLAGEPEKDIYNKIANMTNSYETKLIISQTPDEFERNYSSYISDMDKMGALQVEAYMTKSIARVKPLYTNK